MTSPARAPAAELEQQVGARRGSSGGDLAHLVGARRGVGGRHGA
jgi:hypothetical protein